MLSLVQDYGTEEPVAFSGGQIRVISESKEGDRVAKLIKKNREQEDQNANVFVATISASGIKEVWDCSNAISAKEPTATVMILAVSGRSLFVATILTPETRDLCTDWLDASIKGANFPGVTTKSYCSLIGVGMDLIEVYELSYADLTNEYDPEKIIDQVRTNSFSFLRIKGLYTDPPEEKEYTFDDLDM